MKSTETILLILKLRYKRTINRYSKGLKFWKKKEKPAEKREATGRKKAKKPIGMIFILIYMVFVVFFTAFISVNKMGGELDRELFYSAMALVLGLLFLQSIIAETPNVSDASISSSFDVEWLLGFPIKIKVIYFLKLIELSVFNGVGWALIFPIQVAFFWFEGFRWTGPLIAFILTCFLNIVMGTFKIFKEIALKKFIKNLSHMKLIKSVLFIAGTFIFIFVYLSVTNPVPDNLLIKAAGSVFGKIFFFLPSALPVLAAKFVKEFYKITALGFMSGFELCLLVYAGGAAVASVIGNGDIFEASLSGHRGKTALKVKRTKEGFKIFGRETLRLIRDPLYSVQIFGPTLIMFFIFNYGSGSNSGLLSSGSERLPYITGAVAYFGGAYMLLTSVLTVLASENPSVWMLYTFPKNIYSIIKDKIIFFMSFALLFCLLMLSFGIIKNGLYTPRMFFISLASLAGIPIFAFLAGGLAILGTDLFEKEKNRQVSPGQTFLLMFLMPIYGAGFLTGSLWIQCVVFVLVLAFALSSWDRAKEQLPYMLDPEMAPKQSITLSDGLFSAMLFFILQNLAFLPLIIGFKSDKALFFSYNLAGLATVLIVFFNFRRMKIKVILEKTGLVIAPVKKIILPVVLLSVLAVLFAVVYLTYGSDIPYLKELLNKAGEKEGMTKGVLGFLLVVLAAPLFEEFIFRGLIFKALREKKGFLFSAAASAVIFGIIHPQAGVIPVTMLGFCAAFAFESSGTLIAPVLVHLIYNLSITLLS